MGSRHQFKEILCLILHLRTRRSPAYPPTEESGGAPVCLGGRGGPWGLGLREGQEKSFTHLEMMLCPGPPSTRKTSPLCRQQGTQAAEPCRSSLPNSSLPLRHLHTPHARTHAHTQTHTQISFLFLPPKSRNHKDIRRSNNVIYTPDVPTSQLRSGYGITKEEGGRLHRKIKEGFTEEAASRPWCLESGGKPEWTVGCGKESGKRRRWVIR